jgi:hypothetical protein
MPTMPTTSDAIPVVRELPVPLSDAEKLVLGDQLAKKKAEIDNILARKKQACSACNAEKKEAQKELDKVALALNTGTEMREIPCEERRDLESGEIVTYRMDRNLPNGEEIPGSRKPFGQTETGDEKQPGLFDTSKRARRATPPVPKVVCNAIDEDGEIHVIGAELADVISHELQNSKSVSARVDAGERNIVKVVRGKACGTCGIVGGDHRPECDGMKLEEQGLVRVLDTTGIEHIVDLETADDVREANRSGGRCPYDVEDGGEVDLAMVKGEPVYGTNAEGVEHELTPQQIGELRSAIAEMRRVRGRGRGRRRAHRVRRHARGRRGRGARRR